MARERRFKITSTGLHILAMLLMLCDHAWHALVTGNDWMTCLGRLAFPIFAFMIVEGYFHTRNLKRYVLRMLLFAIVSEIPFNLLCSASIVNPFHQNTLWTLLMGIGAIHLNEMARKNGKIWLRAIVAAGTAYAGYLLGFLTMVDYYGGGVLTVLVFYFFRQRKWWCFVVQLAAMIYLNCEMLAGFCYQINLLGAQLEFPRQGFAILALIPIWLYRGEQGRSSRWFRQLNYWFYPVHLVVLYLLMLM